MFGRTTCEDTAIVRERLRWLGVAFNEVDLDLDAGAERLVEGLNGGNQVTPTLLFGGMETAMAEPSLDDLDARLLDHGWPIERPAPTQYQGDLVARALPLLTLVDATGDEMRLTQFRGRRQLAVFFAHSADCRACSGYARQLAAVATRLADAGSRALVVLPGGPDDAARWRAESTSSIAIVADAGGRWRAAVSGRVAPAIEPGGAMILALDRYLAPRIGSLAPDAGGLITPLQAAEWLEFVSFECAECATPIGWDEAD
jgi:peroxiredoxin